MPVNPFAFQRLFHGVTQFCNEKYGENGYSIKSYSIEAPCATGENFLSEIYAIKLDVIRKSSKNCTDSNVDTHKLIAKSQLVDANSDSDVRRYVFNLIFTKERLFYTEVIQNMEKLLLEMNHEQPCLAPKLHTFYTEGETYSCMLLENLTSEGFYTPETLGEGGKLHECTSIMKAMARMHALSLVMEGQSQVPLQESHQICSTEFLLDPERAKSMVPMTQGSYAGLIQLAEKYRPDLVAFLTKLEQEETVWKRVSKYVKPDQYSSFSCLCHGDPRLNNIFINKDDINSVRFIDFQVTRYASPLTDLQYVLKMGATKEFRKLHTDEVLQAYHTEFMRIINAFPEVKLLPEKEAAVKAWTLEKMKDEYEELTVYGFLIGMTLLPLILLRPGDIDKDLTEMDKTERDRFWEYERQQMVFDLGCKRENVRQRLFDICEEAIAVTNKLAN